jgi:hypothetical protein
MQEVVVDTTEWGNFARFILRQSPCNSATTANLRKQKICVGWKMAGFWLTSLCFPTRDIPAMEELAYVDNFAAPCPRPAALL